MNAEQILASTLLAEDDKGGREGMEPIAGVILNRAEDPGKDWWGDDIIGVCINPGQFSCWHWKDPNFRRLLTADIRTPAYRVALEIAVDAVAGRPINRANGATHYYAKSMASPPAWAAGREPCFETEHHLFFKIGPGA